MKIDDTTSLCSTVLEAALAMTRARKGVLVVDAEGALAGILTPKDLLVRVAAQGRAPELTAVASVMTPNPACAAADLTLLDALREMHDSKFLHLPVCGPAGELLGLVDVMDLVCGAAGGAESGGGTGSWRDFFRGALEAVGEDDRSDTVSEASAPRSRATRATGKSEKLNSKASVKADSRAGELVHIAVTYEI